MTLQQQLESGISHHRAGRLTEAEKIYRQILAIDPNHVDALNMLGALSGQMGRQEEALTLIGRAIQLKPDLVIAHSNLGNILRDLGRFDEAVATIQEAIRLQPDYAVAHNNLGLVLKNMGRLDDAIEAYRQAIRFQPDLAEAYSNLGGVILGRGEIDEAITLFRQAIRLKPDYPAFHADLAYALNYHPGLDARTIYGEHRLWSQRHAEPLRQFAQPYANSRDPERNLRIGYVSADFRQHSVGHFFLPLLEHHDRGTFRIYCYANVPSLDGMSERIKRSCDVWRNIVGVSDEAVAQMIRADGIDILVDLSGHTAGNRLLVFARKPAPIQVSYLGYANTTGLPAIDYRFTDALADPPGMTDHLNVEKLWRLPECAWCYLSPEDAPEIQPRGNGPITFGCFNAFVKVNRRILAVWAKLLKRSPGSRLLLKSTGGSEASMRQRITSQFAEHGVTGEQVEILGWAKHPRQHLEHYHQIDVALDTFPYHGTTTTCEALWMGVPVVTLAGQTHLSRVGVSLLTNVGLAELIAQSAEEYASIAADLAGDLPRLAELRHALRPRMKASPLMDAPRFARDIEAAYRQMWRSWCADREHSTLQVPDQTTLRQQLESGMSHHRAGRLAEAEKIYRQVLAQQPDHPDALHRLGMLTDHLGRPDAAVELIQRAIQLRPNLPGAHSNLGNALANAGRINEAIAAYRTAVRLEPNSAEAQNNLGAMLANTGQLEEAISLFQRAIRARPNFSEAYANLGDALSGTGKLDEAIAAYREVIRLRPDHFLAFNKLGNVLQRKEQFNEAIAAHRQAIQLKPDFADAHNNLGNALKSIGQPDEAAASLHHAIRLQPDYAEAYYNLGNLLKDNWRLDDAVAAYRQAIQLKPDLAEAHSNLGGVLQDTGRADEAVNSFRQAARFKPGFAEVHSNLLFALNHQADSGAGEILAEHQAWADRQARPLMSEIRPHANERSPERKLRIGYVSADFCRHSVGRFFLPLPEYHDRRNFELFCYANSARSDDMTDRIKRSSDAWRNIVGLTDEAVAQMIRADGIDILVDLSGHTSGNRLLVFARKPAPIQVTYLGYPNTTGMRAIDYRFTDALADPPGMTDHLNTEKLWRLPVCAWCFQPPDDTPEIQPRGDGPITFGCFNAFSKINPTLTAIWANLLKRVSGSRLLLKSAGAGEASSRQRLTDQFAGHGIPGERIEMLGRIADARRHLELYHRVDVALDTFPYDGTTTTCEALWMGVPVVTLAGRTHVSRVGVSLLNCVGLPELVAQTPEEYVSIASDLAADPTRLSTLRRNLRNSMSSSPLMNGARFAADVEAAYRQMWRLWCAQRGDSNSSTPDRTTLQQQIESAVSHHRAGRLREADEIYRQILALDPDNVDVLHLQGALASQMGNPEAALELIGRAIRLKPDLAAAHNNLGKTLRDLGRINEAIAAFREAARLKPDYAQAYSNLGSALEDNGQHDEAIAACRQAIGINPDYAEAYVNLGNSLEFIGQTDEAIANYWQAVRLKPDLAEGLSNLGNALKGNGLFGEAIALHREAIRLRPDLAETHLNLGLALEGDGQLDEAVAAQRQAIRLKSDCAEAHCGLGNALRSIGQFEEAISSYRKAIQLKLDSIELRSGLIFALNYQPDGDVTEILAEHRTWADRYAQPLLNEIKPHANERSPERKLRIGYVSGDFGRHVVSHFFLPLLEHHNRGLVEVFCYSNVKNPDEVTDRIKRSSDAWRNIVGLTDEAVAQMVRADGIDILVDLSGHTSGNRLLVFARKPAPIQVTYLGYPNTTGMRAIDYRFTDVLADPPGMTDHLNTEKLWRLPVCAWCFQPPDDTPEIQPRGDGPITFGCFNAFSKINPTLTAIWANLLKRVSGSRLLLKSAGAGEASSRQRLTDQFAGHGIPGERIEMLGRIADARRHLELYHRVDVALDTFPYDGTTTTCEALWMGVPVVTLAGRTHVSRVGVSLLNCVGLPELVAQTPEEYVSIASDLAADPTRLRELRGSLRSKMSSSPLLDGIRFAAGVEAAYRQMWRLWCAVGDT